MESSLSTQNFCRRQSDSASSLRAAEGTHRHAGGDAPNGRSPPSIQEEPVEGHAVDADAAAIQALPPGMKPCPR